MIDPLKLIKETEIFFETRNDSYYNQYEKKIFKSGLISAGGVIGSKNAQKITNVDGGAISMLSSNMLLGLGVSAFGYMLYKYLNSYLRYTRTVRNLENKLKSDSKNVELQEKLKEARIKLEEARKRAYIEERSNIEKLKEYEIKLHIMKKENVSKQDIIDLEQKIKVKRNALQRAGIILKK